MSFQNLQLIEPILKALSDEGYENPTPIQEKSIPIILSRKDLLGCAQTGTGKTAAFAIPLLQLLCEEAAGIKEDTGIRAFRPIKALVLTPTRELAIQIGESFAAYGKYTGLKHLVIFGGVPQHSQVQGLKQGIDILVATPGRLLDLMDQRFINLKDIQFFVLDEADRMLDMGFVHDVKKVIAKLPQKRQTLFFSATMPPEIQKLAASILVNPSRVEVTPVSSTAETIQQSLYYVDKKDKKSLLLHVLKSHSIPTALVFTRTKHGADKVAKGLSQAGIRAEAIHGNKSQNARQRALQNFKSRHTRILVATDIAARGIDIDELTHVINFEMPNVPETYVHRIGRTGRAGANGTALSFCDHEEKEYLRDIEKLIARNIPVVEDHPHVLIGGISASASVTPGQDHNQRHGRQNGRNNNGNQQRRNPEGGNGIQQRRSPDQRNDRRNTGAHNDRRNPEAGNGNQLRRIPENGNNGNQLRRNPAPGQQQHNQVAQNPETQNQQIAGTPENNSEAGLNRRNPDAGQDQNRRHPDAGQNRRHPEAGSNRRNPEPGNGRRNPENNQDSNNPEAGNNNANIENNGNGDNTGNQQKRRPEPGRDRGTQHRRPNPAQLPSPKPSSQQPADNYVFNVQINRIDGDEKW